MTGLPTPASRRPVPTAVVLGAGIAGLTAAHELAERGFSVTVYEPATDERTRLGPGHPGDHPPVRLGGLAASQFSTIRGDRARLRPFPGRAGHPDRPRGVVPGEHGFRLFPAYYLHLWDLLQRIPCYQPDGTDTAGRTRWRAGTRTVMDNVRRVVVQATTVPGRPSLVFPRDAPRSLGEIVTVTAQLAVLGFTPGDVRTFAQRLVRYLVTSPPRRAAELADLSAYDFFTGRPAGGDPRYAYSPRTELLMLDLPKVLAAFDSHWGDARTNVTTYLQLLLHTDRGEGKADGVLNGPTTEAWFDHWYRHLVRLGVRFVRGTAVSIEPPRPGGHRLPAHRRARVRVVLADGTRVGPDYLVVAVDAPGAERITAALRRAGTGGAVAGLDGFTTSVAPPEGPLQPGPGRPVGRRDPYDMAQTGRVPWDRFQTLAGIQFYFDTEFQLVRGHVYYSGTEWGLSSIGQQAMWERRPILCRDGFVSVLSVDIGNFTAPSHRLRHPDGRGKAARECSADELAVEVWRQISAAVLAGRDPAGPWLPTPVWYALDRNLAPAGGSGPPLRNEAPYLVPIVGDWDNRPDGEPWNPNGTSWTVAPTTQQWRDDLDRGHVWRAGHGGYPVHHNSLVFAGTWTRTFTRLTSMEAACESARHAVNAILDHYLWVESDGVDPRTDTSLDWRFPFDFVDQGYSGPVRQPTPAGDYCYVFDIENREPVDARALRDLDAEYLVAGLPHPLDTLSLPSGGPTMTAHPSPSGDDYAGQLLGYLQAWRQYLEHAAQLTGIPTPPSWPAPPSGPPGPGGTGSAGPPPIPQPPPISSWPGTAATPDPEPARAEPPPVPVDPRGRGSAFRSPGLAAPEPAERVTPGSLFSAPSAAPTPASGLDPAPPGPTADTPPRTRLLRPRYPGTGAR